MDDCKAGTSVRPAKEPISHEVMNVLERLASSAEKLAGRTADKLHPICRTACPSETGLGKEAKEYPPLFNDMRGYLGTIENSIAQMNEVLDRAEV